MTLYEQKWQKFLSRTWLFRFIPFIDFVFVAGSLATGNVREESDFDVIVGARQGRIFTVRFLCFLFFRPLGWWAKHPGKAKDKICFNHFVTPNAYRLSPPHNEYWKKLYLSLIPILGNKIVIQRFYRANEDWIGHTRLYEDDNRHVYAKPGKIKKVLERLLSGKFGDRLEKIFRKIQLEKMKTSSNQGSIHKPRIIMSDDELEFHPHTKRIEDFFENLKR